MPERPTAMAMWLCPVAPIRLAVRLLVVHCALRRAATLVRGPGPGTTGRQGTRRDGDGRPRLANENVDERRCQ
jgi:hypothetical protein